MTRAQYFGLLGLVGCGLVVVASMNSNAQRIVAPKVAVGGAGSDLLHMGPFLEVTGTETIPVVLSNQSTLFRIFNDGQQTVRILNKSNDEIASIAPGKFQFIGDTHMKVVGTEKDKVSTVYFVHLK